MDTHLLTSYNTTRAYPIKSRQRSKPIGQHAIGKRLQIYNKVELATLFGVPLSELGKLGHMGVIQRIGADRYLLDYHQATLLLGRQKRVPINGVAARGIRSAQLGNALRAINADPKDRAIYQKIADFYTRNDKILESNVNILNVPDLQHATIAAGIFLEEGLDAGERVVVLSFEHPDMLFSRFAEAGLMFEDALQTEQLIYLYYKPDVAHSISLSVDYLELFGEAMRLGGDGVQRLVLFNVDALINANSEHLVHTSLHQLIYAANHYHVTLLGLFVASGHVAELIDEGCRAILPGYFVLG